MELENWAIRLIILNSEKEDANFLVLMPTTLAERLIILVY